MMVLDKPEAIEAFHLLSQRSAMRLEIAGMRHSSGRSICAHVKRTYKFKGNKVKVLEQFEALLREKGVLVDRSNSKA